MVRGRPFEFCLGSGQVIAGWERGVATMKVGERTVLTCAPVFAYGSSGAGSDIPPNASLNFEVELLGWKERTAASGVAAFLDGGGSILLMLDMLFFMAYEGTPAQWATASARCSGG